MLGNFVTVENARRTKCGVQMAIAIQSDPITIDIVANSAYSMPVDHIDNRKWIDI